MVASIRRNSLELRSKYLALLIWSSVIGIMDWIATLGSPAEVNADMFRPTLDRAWPVYDATQFHDLLRAIDDADREYRDGRERPMVH